MIDTERERGREKQAPRQEPNVGLDPGTPGLCPGPKSGAKPLSHPGIPPTTFYDLALASHTINSSLLYW